MSLAEYEVSWDFFQCGEGVNGGFEFPCNVCQYNKKGQREFPCKFCGHNICAVDFYQCRTCGKLKEKHGHDDTGLFIAGETIGPICRDCYDTIVDDVSKMFPNQKTAE